MLAVAEFTTTSISIFIITQASDSEAIASVKPINPVKYTDPDGRETDTSLNNLKKVAKEIRATGSIDGKNIYLSPTNLRRDGCFARASIIAEGLRAKGYKVDYAFANNPKIP